MTRKARAISTTGYYHIIFRGVNHCLLFEEEEDYEKFLSLLERVKEELALNICAYCLMGNHVHLLLREASQGDITSAMRKLLTPYALWFNKRYQRSGTLIANRFKSECVEDDAYLLTLVCYIHKNPLKAGLASCMEDYRWSSYRDYTSRCLHLVDTELVLRMFSNDTTQALKGFIEFHNDEKTQELVHSVRDTRRKPDEHIRTSLLRVFDGLEPAHVARLEKNERNRVIVFLRNQGFSIRQIERATGISKGVIERVR